MYSVYHPEEEEIIKFVKIDKTLYYTKQTDLVFQSKEKAWSPQ